jgi:hypothetical protein
MDTKRLKKERADFVAKIRKEEGEAVLGDVTDDDILCEDECDYFTCIPCEECYSSHISEGPKIKCMRILLDDGTHKGKCAAIIDDDIFVEWDGVFKQCHECGTLNTEEELVNVDGAYRCKDCHGLLYSEGQTATDHRGFTHSPEDEKEVNALVRGNFTSG